MHPPQEARVLLPVWGDAYTRQFLSQSLPTLLARGNLPALAETLPTEFLFLTDRLGEITIGADPAYAGLARICPVRFLRIDDLIIDGNHSTTITLAYARAVRRSGPAMLDTCFFFLVSDYILADGSLAAVLARMTAGARAVQAGNFQVVEEDGVEWLDDCRDPASGVLAIAPRELMRRSLRRLHPVTVANTVNVPLSHTAGSNRLFWRVDGDTLIGRFYLMHMIAVRPELMNFVIGASCDYSFVAEMCPSGRVDCMTDSDEYLVVEMQPAHHEAGSIKLGPVQAAPLAASLSAWTTAPQRANAAQTLVFHAGDVPPATAAMIAEADAFVAEVARHLRPRPKPYRGHPFWRAAMAAFHAHTGRRPNEQDWQIVLGRRTDLLSRLLRRAARSVFGRVPKPQPWHPLWADYAAPVKELQALMTARPGPLLVISAMPTALTNWLSDSFDAVVRVPVARALNPDFKLFETPQGGFAGCFIELTEADLLGSARIVEFVLPLLAADAPLLVAAASRGWALGEFGFEAQFLAAAQPLFSRNDIAVEEARFVGSGRMRRWAAHRLLTIQACLVQPPRVTAPLRLLWMLPAAMVAGVACMFGNLLSRKLRHRPGRSGQVLTSVLLRLRATPAATERPRRRHAAADARRRQAAEAAAIVALPPPRQPEPALRRVGS